MKDEVKTVYVRSETDYTFRAELERLLEDEFEIYAATPMNGGVMYVLIRYKKEILPWKI